MINMNGGEDFDRFRYPVTENSEEDSDGFTEQGSTPVDGTQCAQQQLLSVS